MQLMINWHLASKSDDDDDDDNTRNSFVILCILIAYLQDFEHIISTAFGKQNEMSSKMHL